MPSLPFREDQGMHTPLLPGAPASQWDYADVAWSDGRFYASHRSARSPSHRRTTVFARPHERDGPFLPLANRNCGNSDASTNTTTRDQVIVIFLLVRVGIKRLRFRSVRIDSPGFRRIFGYDFPTCPHFAHRAKVDWSIGKFKFRRLHHFARLVARMHRSVKDPRD